MSNALDYIKDGQAIRAMLRAVPSTQHAKVVTSAQAPKLEPFLGSFAEPRVHAWAEFLALFDKQEFLGALGSLY
jgi:hypothetical protein